MFLIHRKNDSDSNHDGPNEKDFKKIENNSKLLYDAQNELVAKMRFMKYQIEVDKLTILLQQLTSIIQDLKNGKVKTNMFP